MAKEGRCMYAFVITRLLYTVKPSRHGLGLGLGLGLGMFVGPIYFQLHG